jgi:hypothetical protein
MVAKVKKIITVMDLRPFLHHRDGEDFEVTKLVNTVEFEIGQVLAEGEIRKIIAGGLTTVNVIPHKK